MPNGHTLSNPRPKYKPKPTVVYQDTVIKTRDNTHLYLALVGIVVVAIVLTR